MVLRERSRERRNSVGHGAQRSEPVARISHSIEPAKLRGCQEKHDAQSKDFGNRFQHNFIVNCGWIYCVLTHDGNRLQGAHHAAHAVLPTAFAAASKVRAYM